MTPMFTTLVAAGLMVGLGATAVDAMPAVAGSTVTLPALTTPNIDHVYCGYGGCHRHFYRGYYRPYGYYQPYRYYRPYGYGYGYGPHIGIGLGGIGVY